MVETLKRGDIWIAFCAERWLVVLLSCERDENIEAIRIVTPATQKLVELAVEVPLGNDEGLQCEGALRVARQDRTRSTAIGC
jgi:hypothetical protein